MSFSPSDLKFATSSDDSTVKVHDFLTSSCESSLTGHGGDVRWVDWHPSRGVIASASTDASVKLWEPRSGSCAATLHGHKNGILQVSGAGVDHHIAQSFHECCTMDRNSNES